MPGIFVVAGDRFSREQRADFVRRMITLDRERTVAPFGPKPEWIVETANDDFASIGCAHLGVFSETTMSSREVPRRLTAAAFGNISLRDGEPVARMPDAAATMLDMYLESGTEFVEKLEGDFVVVISDPDEERLVVFNDRLGLVPHYVADPPGLFAMAPNLSAVACLPGVDDEVDMVGLADLLTFGYILADDTIVRGVKVLPPASASDYRDGRWRTRAYWELKVEPGRTPRASTQEHIERIGELMSDAVRRCVPPDGRVTVSLSGGLDSRFVACALHKEGIPFDAFTLGADDACDVKFSRMLCERLGIEQTVVEPRYDEAWERLNWLAARQDGMVNVFHNFGASHRLSHCRPTTRTVVTGFIGDAIAGHDLTPGLLLTSRGHLPRHVLSVLGLCGQALLEQVVPATHRPNTIPIDKRIEMALAGEDGCPTWAVFLEFMLNHRERKFINYGNQTVRGHVEPATPIAASRIVEHLSGLSFGHLFLRHLYRGSICALFPEVRSVPYDFIDLPPCVSRARILLQRLGKRGRLPEPLGRAWRRWVWDPDHPGHLARYLDRVLARVRPVATELVADATGDVTGVRTESVLDLLAQQQPAGRDGALIQHLLTYILWHTSRPTKWSVDTSELQPGG